MRGDFYQQLANDLETARAEGLFKEERIITSAQQAGGYHCRRMVATSLPALLCQ
ncbi:hypothetical protein MJK71_27550 [Escherichia coli]|nr:hypothetical protein MJK71_27550 [Escherichia coli]